MKRWKTLVGLVALAAWSISPMVALGAEGHGPHAKRETHGPQSRPADRKPKLPLCPVMGDPVDFSVSLMTDDGPIYFCCGSCRKKFKADPVKYAKNIARQRRMLAKMPRIQVTCPVSGEPVDPKVFVEKGGKKVYFCCAGCKPKYSKNPAKYAGKLAAAYTYQTRCPVRGEQINPTVFTDLPTKQRIYFCCAGCDKKFLAHPEKYVKNLAKQGINVDLKKLKAIQQTEKAAAKHHRGNKPHQEKHEGHGHHQ